MTFVGNGCKLNDIFLLKGVKFMDAIFEKVKEIIVDQLEAEEDKVTMEASFIDDLEADSLDVVELVMELEDEFDMEIAEEDAESIKTVGDAVNYINSNR